MHFFGWFKLGLADIKGEWRELCKGATVHRYPVQMYSAGELKTRLLNEVPPLINASIINTISIKGLCATVVKAGNN